MNKDWKWRSVQDDPPAEGVPVYIISPEDNCCDVAYFYNGDFFKLELDPILDVLRKTHINGTVTNWTTI